MSNFLAGFLSGFAPEYIDGLKKKQQEEREKAWREFLTTKKRNQPYKEPATGGNGAPDHSVPLPGMPPEDAPAAAGATLNQFLLNPSGTKFKPYVFNANMLQPLKNLPFSWFGPQ